LPEQPKYVTARAFRVALKDRVKRICRENTAIRPEDLYRTIAFDRFLARIDYQHWTLKGGYSLERRLPQLRSTKDIDLASTDAALIMKDKEEQGNRLINAIRKVLVSTQVFDHFSFELRKAEKTGSDLALRSADGLKVLRFDLVNSHGLQPHINVEENVAKGLGRFTNVNNFHIFFGN
jgi:hypothetical protein